MFLLKPTTLLALMTSFVILLPDLNIQAEDQTETQPETQSAQPQALGLMCHDCVPCKSDTDLGKEITCASHDEYCYWGERRSQDGTKTPVRGCATASHVHKYSCDIFTSYSDTADMAHRVCPCTTDRCNYQKIVSLGQTTNGASFSSSQLLLILFVPVVVHVFRFLMK